MPRTYSNSASASVRNAPLQILLGERMDRVEQFVGKFAADHSADLRHLLGRPQPIEPRHQGVMQRHRNLALGEFRIATLEHRSCQLFNKQGHPAGALEYRRDGFLRQCLLRRYFPTIVRTLRALSRLSVICV